MESLGFSDTNSVWSDNPSQTTVAPRPAPTQPDLVNTSITDREPTDFGAELADRTVRWGVLTTLLIFMVGVAGVGFWLYQRPRSETTAAMAAVEGEAAVLATSLPRLEELDAALTSHSDDIADIDTTTVDVAARRLFDAGSDLPASEAATRYLATGAASSALDGVRLAEEARTYSLAVSPILTVPELETDPAVVALDDAVRAFGGWQLWFDEVRTALPETVLPDVTQHLDVLAVDLNDFLGRYIDALREDDQTEAVAVLAHLGDRLGETRSLLDLAISGVAERVGSRIKETREALNALGAT